MVSVLMLNDSEALDDVSGAVLNRADLVLQKRGTEYEVLRSRTDTERKTVKSLKDVRRLLRRLEEDANSSSSSEDWD